MPSRDEIFGVEGQARDGGGHHAGGVAAMPSRGEILGVKGAGPGRWWAPRRRGRRRTLSRREFRSKGGLGRGCFCRVEGVAEALKNAPLRRLSG